MKKIVTESLIHNVDESFLGNITGSIKKAFEKIKGFFFHVINGEPTDGSFPPVNIGIMAKNNQITSAVAYLPSPIDIDLEPSLRYITEMDLIERRDNDNTSISESYSALFEAVVPLKHPDKNIKNVGKTSLERRIRMAINNPLGKPVMIWGAPGIGKTEIVKAVLRARGTGRIIDVQTSKMQPDDWALPAIYTDSSNEMHARDLPKSWLPVYTKTGNAEEDKKRNDIANLGGGGILFLDELSRANTAVQNTCLKLIGERMIGDSVLGDRWTMISAANREIDEDEGIEFGKALANRFSQVNYVPSFEDWKEWAIGKVDQRIIDFLGFSQPLFYTMDDDPDKGIFASPRSWHAASDNIAMLMQDAKEEGYKITNNDIEEIISSDVGVDVAKHFMTFLHILKTFKKSDIQKILNDPMNAPLPRKAGSGFDLAQSHAIMSLVLSSTESYSDENRFPAKIAENFVAYLIRLDNGTLAASVVKSLWGLHPYMHEEIGEEGGLDTYKKAWDSFEAHYGDLF